MSLLQTEAEIAAAQAAEAELAAAAATLLAAIADPAPPSLTIAGGRVTVSPNRTITIEAPTTITLGSGVDAAALEYLALLATRDASADAEAGE